MKMKSLILTAAMLAVGVSSAVAEEFTIGLSMDGSVLNGVLR